jgi:hypothetical protein
VNIYLGALSPALLEGAEAGKTIDSEPEPVKTLAGLAFLVGAVKRNL